MSHFYYCMSTVKLIHYTQDGDDLVSYMARVSNPNNQNNTETSAKLIKYLIKHQHWSPFEMVNMCRNQYHTIYCSSNPASQIV